MNSISVQDLLTLNVELGSLVRVSGKLSGKTAYWIGKIKRKCEEVSKSYQERELDFRKEFATKEFDEEKYKTQHGYITPWKKGGEAEYLVKRQGLLNTMEPDCIPDFTYNDFDYKNDQGEIVTAATPAIFLALADVIKDPS